jgi:hypothetical protein
MLRQIRSVLSRCGPTLAQDAAGAIALAALLFGALHLPLFV